MSRIRQNQPFFDQPTGEAAGRPGGDIPGAKSTPEAFTQHVAAIALNQSVPATSLVKVLTANESRAYLLFQNQGTDIIWLGIGVNPGIGNGLMLAPGAVYEPNTNGRMLFFNDIYAIANSGSQLLYFIEGSFRGA